MRRLVVGAVLSIGLVGGMAAPAFAGSQCYPPPPQCDELRPGWGGLGAVQLGDANTNPPPGGGAGDQNHCHTGPPGQGFDRTTGNLP
jgi:hypothetical protein